MEFEITKLSNLIQQKNIRIAFPHKLDFRSIDTIYDEGGKPIPQYEITLWNKKEGGPMFKRVFKGSFLECKNYLNKTFNTRKLGHLELFKIENEERAIR
jgi:hypothetical protein